MVEKNPITPEGAQKLRDELHRRKTVDRPAISLMIAEARAHGDLSENAEYHAAKDQQGLQEARVRQIRQMLESVEIIQSANDGVVAPGKIVTIRHEGEEPETYLIGSREERGGDHDVLTPDSPIGRALVGRSAGETVSAQVPAGELKVEIVSVQPG